MRFVRYFFLFLTIQFIVSCIDNPCKDSNIVCRDSYSSLFRLISKTDGRDLIFGSTGLYDKSKIRVFSVTGNDTTFANYQPYRLVMNGYDSVSHFDLSSKADTLYIQLNNSDVDTIAVTYGQAEGRCCSFNAIRFMNYNNTGALPNFNGTVEFKK